MATTEDPACPLKDKGGRGEGMRSSRRDFPSPSKEWDQCVKKGTLTVGYGMAAGMVLGTMMGMSVPLVWGLGASMLWSVKRCRALMRDGIMTPEQKREKKEEAARGRLEKKRNLEEASKKSKKNPEEPKPKGGKKLDAKEDNHECCKKLKEILEKQDNKECDLFKKIDKELEKCGIKDKSIQDKIGVCTKTPSDKSMIARIFPGSKINFRSTTTVKLFVPQSPAFRTRITANGTDVCMCMVGKDGNIETCPSCASLLSSKNEVETPIQLTLLGEGIKKDTENIENVNFSEPQAAADENQNDDEPESGPESLTQILPGDEEDRKNPSELLFLQEVSSTSENQNLEDDGGHEGEQNASLFFDEQTGSLDEDIEEEVIEIKGNVFEVIIQEVDDDSGDDDDDSSIAEPEVTIPEVVEGLAQQLSNLDEQCIQEELRKEEVIFVETYKSESWPFSFSLPSLDKFHKKSTDSAFKWPPLPSSIIVKPKKEPICTCPESTNPNDHHENRDEHQQTKPLHFKACTCGRPRESCKCKAQDDT